MFFNKSKSGKSSSKSKRDFVAKILSVVAAIALWLYVVDFQNTIEQKTIYDVPVAIENFDNSAGVTIVSGMNISVDVVVRGSKNDIEDLTNNNIFASVDMTDYSTLGDHRCEIKVKTPDNVAVVGKSIENINVSVDNMHYGEFEIKVIPTQYVLAPNLMIDSVLVDDGVKSVSVSGPERLINSVKGAEVRFDIGEVNESGNIYAAGRVVLVDDNNNIINSPYLKTSPEHVEVVVNVKPVIESKSFENVEISILNYDSVSDKYFFEFPDGNVIDSVTVFGDKSVIETMSEADVFAFVNASDISSEGKYTLDVKFSLPNGVHIDDSNLIFADVVCHEIHTASFPVTVVGKDEELPKLVYYLDEELAYVSGPKSVLSSVASVNAVVNVNDISEGASVEADIELFDRKGKKIEDSRLRVDKSSVNVNVISVADSLLVETSADNIMKVVEIGMDSFSDSDKEYNYLVK